MPVNGWMGLTFDLRRPDDPAHPSAEVSQLRRAVSVARRPASHREAASAASADLHRTAVEAQQAILRHAVRSGDLVLVRRTARALRTRDLDGDRAAVEGLLAVVRDARSAEIEVLEAATRLASLHPACG